MCVYVYIYLSISIYLSICLSMDFSGGSAVKDPPSLGPRLDLRWGRSPGEGHGNPLQFSQLENPMDRGDWRDTGHREWQSQTRLKQFSTHTHIYTYTCIHTVLHVNNFNPLACPNVCYQKLVFLTIW